MRRKYYLLVGVLILSLIFTATGCNGGREEPDWSTGKNPTEFGDSGTQSSTGDDPLPESTAPTPESVGLSFNNAVSGFNALHSYTMTGSVSSSSTMGDITTTVVTSVDCKFEKLGETAHALFVSSQSLNGRLMDHSTYYTMADDGTTLYYIDTVGIKYLVNTNDFEDYDASMYLMPVEDTAITGLEITPMPESNSTQIRFQIPCGIYASKALSGLFGALTDDALLQAPLTIRVVLDPQGLPESIYMTADNETTFADDTILQNVTVSLNFSAFNETLVDPPSDLDTYEDRTYEGSQDEAHTGILSPEDVD